MSHGHMLGVARPRMERQRGASGGSSGVGREPNSLKRVEKAWLVKSRWPAAPSTATKKAPLEPETKEHTSS